MKLALQICDAVDTNAIDDLRECPGLVVLEGEERVPAGCTHLLRLDGSGLSLKRCAAMKGETKAGATRVDFTAPALEYRQRTTGRSAGIARAVGIGKADPPAVLDVCAGLGRDAWILAALGCRVTMLERSLPVHALLEDGLRRALDCGDSDIESIAGRLELHRMDARQWLRDIIAGSRPLPDVVYLDPMFPVRGKQARVKKDIAVLQEVVGVDEDVDELLALARRCARRRVVLKRPGRASKNSAADFQITGKSAHYEVYVAPS